MLTKPVLEIVDAHHHLWNLDRVSYPWLSDRLGGKAEAAILGDYSAIRRNFERDDYLRATAGYRITATVHVESGAADPLAETAWLSQTDSQARPAIAHALVVACDLCTPEAAEVLDRHLALSQRVKSVRSLGRGRTRMYADPLFRRQIRLLAERSLRFDMRVIPTDMDDAASLAADNPDIPIVVPNMGMPIDRSPDGVTLWRRGMKQLASLPNVAVKMSGLVMTDHAATVPSMKPFVWDAIDYFGCDRMIFGSNLPVDGLFCSFSALMEAYLEILSPCTDRDRSAIFAENAVNFYDLGGRLETH